MKDLVSIEEIYVPACNAWRFVGLDKQRQTVAIYCGTRH